MALYISDRHEALQPEPWSLTKSKQIISEIVELTIKSFQGDKLWPVHPDLKNEYHLTQPITGLYNGAAGSIWAIMELQQRNAHLTLQDFTLYMDTLINKQAIYLAEYDPKANIDVHAPGYRLGYAGINLLRWKLTHDASVLDVLEENIKKNINADRREIYMKIPSGVPFLFLMLIQSISET